MSIGSIFGLALDLLRRHPYVWLLALLAILSDIGAVLSYNPSQVNFAPSLIWFFLLSLLAEIGVLYAVLQHAQGVSNSLVDAFMMSAVSFVRLLPIKAVIMLASAPFFMLSFVLVVIESPPAWLIGIVVAAAFLVLTFSQTWTIFAFCGYFVQEYTAGESFSRGWRLIWDHKRLVLQAALPFLLIDLLLLSLLVAGGVVTYDSAFMYVVTDEIADHNLEMFQTGQRQNMPGPTREGAYFRVNRVLNSYGVSLFKARGVEVLSIPLYFTNNAAAGLLAVAIGLLLIPLRISVLALIYLQISEPVREVKRVIHEIRRERAAAAAQNGPVPSPQPAAVVSSEATDAGWRGQWEKRKTRWILVGLAFPLLYGIAMFGLCWVLKTWQVWIFAQPWESGPLEGCPNWLPVDSRKPHFDDAAARGVTWFCAFGQDSEACQGKLLSISEPYSQQIRFMRRSSCGPGVEVEVLVLVQEGSAHVSFEDLGGVTSPLEAAQGELLSVIGIADQGQGFTINLEPIGGEVRGLCYGTRTDLSCGP